MVTVPHSEHAHEHGFDMVTVAPFSETVGAIAIIVLSIIGLTGTVAPTMLAISTIVIGAAILMQGANTASEYAAILALEQAGIAKPAAIGSGITLEFLAGGTGVVLGILALLTPLTLVLSSAALIVFGGTLLVSSGATARGVRMQTEGAAVGFVAQSLMREAATVSAGAQIMIGIAAVVLGILALVGAHAMVLALVGQLVIGAALLMVSAGTSVAGLWRNA